MPEILNDFSLKPYNTFGLDESARLFCEVTTLDELRDALQFAEANQLEVLILGGGSNLLLTKSFDGLVIRISNTGKTVVKQESGTAWLDVAAGESWHPFVLYTLSQQFYGLENLSLIPGSVGASPMQNIGAYGVEAGQLIESVTYLDRQTLELKTIGASDCQFGYRESIFKHELKDKAIIWSVQFRLRLLPNVKVEYGDIQKILNEKGIAEPTPNDVSQAVIAIRQSKLPDPTEIGNAGSFFKNPVISATHFEKLKQQFPTIPSYPAGDGKVKVPAGWLIETAGWKGKRFGNYGVHERQALVLVNYGGATGQNIGQLAKDIQADIKTRFQIDLQAEVNFI